MPRTTTLLFLAAAMAAGAHATSLQYEVANVSGNVFVYTYTLNGFVFQPDYELDIDFDPGLFGTLSNGVAPVDFNLILFQPNSPIGAQGVYSAKATTANPSLTGTFSVEVVYLGAGTPGAQNYSVFDDSQVPIQQLQDMSGATVNSAASEPSSWWLLAIGIMAMTGEHLAGKRRRARRAPGWQASQESNLQPAAHSWSM